MKHIPVILQIKYNFTDKLQLSIVRNGQFLSNGIQCMYVATDLPCVHWRKIADIQCSAVTTLWPVWYYYIVS